MTRTAVAVFALTFAAPAFAQEKGRKVAFLVGVGAFKHDLANLGTSPQKDATELGMVLKDGGFEVIVLTDKDATKAGVEERFKKLVDGKGSLAKGDVLMVAFCTHGFSLPPAAGQPDQPFLAAHDSKLNRPDTMVSLNGLIADGKSSGATVLYLIDACRQLPKDANRGQTRGFEPTEVSLPKGTAVLFSCGFGQVSHQNEKAGGGHGLFTYAVLQTLRGERGLKDEVSWNGLVYEVEQAFKSPAFKGMIPAGKPQTPYASAGELATTDLIKVNALAADYSAYCAAENQGVTKQQEHVKAVAPHRLTAWKDQAEKGNPTGQFFYALCLTAGIGVKRDEAEGVRWYLKSANGGNPSGMMCIGLKYADGRSGLMRDDVEAVRWYRRAADAGNPLGLNNLGLMYELGRGGLAKDLNEAIKLYTKAAALGGEVAKGNLKRLGTE